MKTNTTTRPQPPGLGKNSNRHSAGTRATIRRSWSRIWAGISVAAVMALSAPVARALTAGDIAILSMNCDDADQFTFVAINDIPANTTITFTENGWTTATGPFAITEGAIEWSHTDLVKAGTMIAITPTGLIPTASLGSLNRTGTFSFSTGGESIIAWEGTWGDPPTDSNDARFLYGISTRPWVIAGGISSNSSYRPAALDGAATSFIAPTPRNVCYADGIVLVSSLSKTNTKSGLLTVITNGPSQWYLSATRINTLPAYAITVLDSEPTVAPNAPTFSNVLGTHMDVALSGGGPGTNYLVVCQDGGDPTTLPGDGVSYVADAAFGGGTALGGGSVVYKGNGSSFTLTGLSGSHTYYFRVYTFNGVDANDLASGLRENYRTDAHGAASQTTVATGYDSDSKVEPPTTPVAAGNVSALANDAGNAVDVLAIKLRDLGTADGLATKVTQITLTPGAGNTASWATSIQGLKLYNVTDSAAVTIGTPTISDSGIVIPIPSGNLDFPNGAAEDIRISVYLNTANLSDNSVLQFMVAPTAHGFLSSGTGSGFATDFGAAVTGNPMTIRVVATQLAFSSVPTLVIAKQNFSASVQARDANNNLDLDATTAVTISQVTGNGVLTGGSAQNLASGTQTWSSLQLSGAGNFTIQAAGSGLTSVTSGVIKSIYRPLAISGYMANPAGSDSPYEYVQVIGLEAVDFAVTPMSIVFADNGAATTDGWVAGGAVTYKFNLMVAQGSVGVGQVVYIGGSGKLINGAGSTDISAGGPNWKRTLNTATGAGEGFGAGDIEGVLGNADDLAGGAGGIAIFLGTSPTSATVPVDAVCFGTNVGTALVDLGAAGYVLPVNDRYNGGFLQSDSYLFPQPAEGDFTTLTGTYNTATSEWTVPRTASLVSNPSTAAEIASAISIVTPPPRPVIDPNLVGAGTELVQLSFSSVVGLTYRVEYKTNLTQIDWLYLTEAAAAETTTTIYDSVSPVPDERFYRVLWVAP